MPLGIYHFSLTIPAHGDDFSDGDVLEELVQHCREAYFDEGMLPPFRKRDIEYLLRYYAQKETQPVFIAFDEIERDKVDLARIARKIVDEDMRRSEQRRYTKELWEDPTNSLKAYYGKELYFLSQSETEIAKLEGDSVPAGENNVIPDQVSLEDLPLRDWAEHAPQLHNQMKDAVFNKALDGSEYVCTLETPAHPSGGDPVLGYKRRSPQLVRRINSALRQTRLETFARGQIPIRIGDVGLDAMVIFQLCPRQYTIRPTAWPRGSHPHPSQPSARSINSAKNWLKTTEKWQS